MKQLPDFFFTPQDERTLSEEKNWEFFSRLKEAELLSKDKIQDLAKINEVNRAPMSKREMERFTIDFAWKSSRIEGNTYSLLETEDLIKNGTTAGGHTMYEAQMILNHKNALKVILENVKDFTYIKEADAIEVHGLLTEGLGVQNGIRSTQVRITGTNYVPSHDKAELENDLLTALETANSRESPIEKAILLAGLTAYIQPFEDGNKRTGRMLANAALLSHNYKPISYRTVNEVNYKAAQIIIDEQHDFTPFANMLYDQALFSSKEYGAK
jgi:Fic family protein